MNEEIEDEAELVAGLVKSLHARAASQSEPARELLLDKLEEVASTIAAVTPNKADDILVLTLFAMIRRRRERRKR